MELSSKRERKHGGDFSRSITDLPLCLVGYIFSKLPIVEVLRCRRVCKAWQAYISDPEFGTFYSKETPFVRLILYSMHHRSCLAEVKADDSPRVVIETWYRSPVDNEILLGCCNGLLCFLHISKETYEFTVWNPLTGELGFLPPPPIKGKNVKDQAFLFGFNEITKEYKVLRIFTGRQTPGITEAQIFTIGTDLQWRQLLNQPIPIPMPQESKTAYEFFTNSYVCGVTFNGALHWITKGPVRSHLLVSFDIAEEMIRPFPHPRDLVVVNQFDTSLGVLRGCFCIFQNVSLASRVDIWTMNKYGEAESWTKETITCSTCLPRMPSYPFISLAINELLSLNLNGTLTAYNLEQSKATELASTSIYDVHNGFAVPYVPFFLSFENLMKGSGGQLKFVKRSTLYVSRDKFLGDAI